MLRAEGRKALVAYVTAGHPDREQSVALLRGLEQAGVDILEVGVPFSDPLADGPVIQRSSQIAIAQGMTFARALELIREANLSIPVVLFSYLNPILAGGEAALRAARDAGVSGVLVTDMPVGSDREREAWFGESGLDFVRLVAPTTPPARMAEIGRHGGGFVYLISRLGVTGNRSHWRRTCRPPSVPCVRPPHCRSASGLASRRRRRRGRQPSWRMVWLWAAPSCARLTSPWRRPWRLLPHCGRRWTREYGTAGLAAGNAADPAIVDRGQ